MVVIKILWDVSYNIKPFHLLNNYILLYFYNFPLNKFFIINSTYNYLSEDLFTSAKSLLNAYIENKTV